jgi:hypothetical protein
MDACLNEADRLEALLDKDRFKTWGFVIYRCTYQDNPGWENFQNSLSDRRTELS